MLPNTSSFGGALLLIVVSFVFCYAFQLRYSLHSPSFVSRSCNPWFCRNRHRRLFQQGQPNDHDSVAEAYHTAKFIRQVYGPETAIPFYQTIVSHLNPTDYSAASRIAATETPNSVTSSILGSSSVNRTPQPQQKQDIQSFASILRSSNYTASNVNDIFDAPKTYNTLCSATGPIYIKPITSTYPSIPCPFPFPSNTSTEERIDSIECLIALFLLGFSLPRNILISSLMGGQETVCLMERLGLIFSCTIDPTLMVPAVSIFPLDINTHSMNSMDTKYCNLPETPQKSHNRIISLFFVTDWHPNVLLSTTAFVGKKEQLHEGTVMYIGPDSLALVAHWPTVLLTQLPSLLTQDQLLHCYATTSDSTATTTIPYTSFETHHTMDTSKYIKILDLCCGSGIQALSYLSILKCFLSTTNEGRKLKATCVDINRRALRFTRFNAILNDLDESVETIEGNILDWEQTILNSTTDDYDDHYHANFTWTEPETSYRHLLKSAPFDIILANPPFIPVPPQPEALNITDITNSSCFPRLNNHISGCNIDNSQLLINSISKRYGLFSSGGPTGEDILQSIIRIAPRLLSDFNDANSVVAIVSEFMNPDKTLLERINDSWSLSHLQQQPRHLRPNNTYIVNCSSVHFEEKKEWGKTLTSSIHSPNYTDVGVAFTNQFPIPAGLYASRRAADRGGLEEQRWNTHLEQMGIHAVSPGLLCIYRVRATMDNHTLSLCSNLTDTKNRQSISSRISSRLCSYQVILPKSSLGSIWTPHNYEAIMFTMKKIKEVIYTYGNDYCRNTK